MKRVLVLCLVCVGVAFSGVAATLSGSWETVISIDPQEANFGDAIDMQTVFEIDYTVGDWTFSSNTMYSGGSLIQQFEADGALGAFSIVSVVQFFGDPLFMMWIVETGVSIAGIDFGAAFVLSGNDAHLFLDASGVAGDVEIGVNVSFGDYDDVCDLNWARTDVTLGFPFCCADVDLVVSFDCEGFSSAIFVLEGLAISNLLPWVTINSVLEFDLDEGKSLSVAPRVDFGEFACFELEIDIEYIHSGTLDLQDLIITGIGLECDIGVVTFSGYSDFTVLPDGYWEVYSIATSDDACCGPFEFDLTFSFLEGGLRLFDLALIEANMELQVSSQFTFYMGLAVDVDTQAITEWLLGFEVTW